MNIGVTGAKGEKVAAEHLKKKKYKVISVNYQTRFGELDMICEDKRHIVFVEVKTRSKNYMVSGREAVNMSKQRKIITSAMQYLQTHKTKLQPRFDVVEIVTDGENCSITHIENAFTAEGINGFF